MKKQILSYLSLGQICDVQSGGTPSRHINAYWEKGNIPWVKISDIKGKHLLGTDEYITRQGLENSSAKIFPKGTILYTIFATLGETTILNIDAATNQAIAGINIHDQYKKIILTDYLYYYLLSIKDIMCKVGRGVAQNNLNLKILRNVQVPVPTIEEQKKIIDTLSSIEKIMLVKDRQLSLLSNLVKSRFLEMFGNKEYSICQLSDQCEIITKGTTPTTIGYNFTTDGVRFIKIEDITEEGKFDTAKMMHISDECNMIMKRSQLKSGDLLFSIAGAIGRCAVVTNDILPANINQALAIIRLRKDAQLSRNFLFAVLKSSYVEKQYKGLRRGGAQLNLSLKDIGNFKILLPPESEQENFIDLYKQVDKSKMAIQKSLDELETLKKSLMQTYFG